jgi:taurine dioxygenase
MQELPAVGGDTLFASMYAAYEALSMPLKRLLEGMTAIHDGEHVYRGRYGLDPEPGKVYPRAEHPVIRTHPVSGRKALFVNREFTTRIVQLSRHESDAVLEMLYRHVETPEFQCRFQWKVGSIAFWDNRCARIRRGALPPAFCGGLRRLDDDIPARRPADTVRRAHVRSPDTHC